MNKSTEQITKSFEYQFWLFETVLLHIEIIFLILKSGSFLRGLCE